MKTKNSIILLGLACLLCSCSALGKYKPVESVSETLYGDIATSSEDANIATLTWQEFFTDPCLQELIGKALEQNIDLRIAYEHIVQAEAQLTGTKLAFTPTLNLAPSGTFAFGEGSDGTALSSTLKSFDLSATSTWQLDIFRKINNQKMAKANKEQMTDYYQAVRSKLVASVANTYYTLLMLDAELVTAIGMQKTWDKSLETVVALKDAGGADQVAVSQYSANLAKVSAKVVELQKEIISTEDALWLLLGSEPQQGMVRGLLAQQQLPANLSVGVPMQLLSLRPDIRAAERSMEQAHYTTRAAWLNFFPSLSLSGSIGFASSGTTGALSPLSAVASTGAALIAPIFNAGANRTNLKVSESMQREASLSFEKALLTAGNEVNEALHSYHGYEQMATYYTAQVLALQKASEDTEYLMRNSLDKTYLDVLYAYNSLFDALFTKIGNEAQKMQAAVALYNALGGGAI